MFVSAVQGSESVLCTQIHAPSWASVPPPSHAPGQRRAPRWAPGALRQVPLASFFMCGGVYTSVLLPQFVSPSPCTCVPIVCSQRLYLYSCPADRLLCTIFLDFTYMHYNNIKYHIYVFPFLTYFTLYDRRWSIHIHHKWPNFISFYGHHFKFFSFFSNNLNVGKPNT